MKIWRTSRDQCLVMRDFAGAFAFWIACADFLGEFQCEDLGSELAGGTSRGRKRCGQRNDPDEMLKNRWGPDDSGFWQGGAVTLTPTPIRPSGRSVAACRRQVEREFLGVGKRRGVRPVRGPLAICAEQLRKATKRQVETILGHS